MFDYLEMAYKFCDYTIMIAVTVECWPKRIVLVLELWVLLSSCLQPLLKHSLQISLAV